MELRLSKKLKPIPSPEKSNSATGFELVGEPKSVPTGNGTADLTP
jgi:hypothetical protein